MKGQLVQNEDASIVTKSDARRVLARAMVALGRAPDPKHILGDYEDAILAALKVLGGNHPLARVLGFQPTR